MDEGFPLGDVVGWMLTAVVILAAGLGLIGGACWAVSNLQRLEPE